MITGQAARDVARHFVQRWNFIKQSKYRDRDGMLFLLPPSQLSDTEVQQRLRPELPTCRLQMLRSVSHWSMGADREMSIYDAYMHAIGSAVHYIYIENQFFVSSIGI